MSAVRLALLTEIPAPYRLPLFRALAAEDGIELRVLFLARSDPRRSYPFPEGDLGFPSDVLRGLDVVRGGRWTVLSRGVIRALARVRPDAIVVGGWNQPAFWEALGYARARRRPLVTWVESTARDARTGAFPTGLGRLAFVRASAAFLVPGRAAAAYLRSLGVEDERIVVARNAVDAARFGRQRCPVPDRGPDEPVRFLFVGRLSREKGLDFLFRAAEGLPVEIIVIGTGPERERVERVAPANVRFLGHVDEDELARRYASADALVLPSLSEPWGMVLNEAAAAGLPLVATDAVGAAHDLIEDGVNGFVVRAGDERSLRDALRRVAEDAAFRQAAGARSRELSRAFTPESWAAAVAGLARRLAG